jgi:hypothetical protein
METGFDVAYLVFVISLGIVMCVGGRSRRGCGRGRNEQLRLFGIMALVLGCGDAFHLLPRAYGLMTDSMDASVAALGFGKFITSVTMTVFYVLLYHVLRSRYRGMWKPSLTAAVYILAAVRIALCLFPQNDWFSAAAPLSWGIYRNIPFVVLGALIVCLSFTAARRSGDRAFALAWLTVLLSFAFYVPVVLWADAVPVVGMLMIPKTLCYVWLIMIGFREFRRSGPLS